MEKQIAVIMSAYNESGGELSAAIDSILSQTLENYEFIIINDNPENSELEQVLNTYENRDKRIRIIRNKKNIGLAASLNIGISATNAEYIARQDADDISYPDRLKIQADYLENNKSCSLVCANRVDIGDNSDLLGTKTNFAISDDKIKRIMPYGSVVIHPTVMMRKQIVEELGGYRALRSGQDYDLWLRMIAHGYNIHVLPDVLLKYRIRLNSISNLNFAKQYFSSKFAVESFRILTKKGESAYENFTYDSFIERNHVNDSEYVNALNTLYTNMNSVLREHQYNKILHVICGVIKYPEMLRFIIRGIIFKLLLMRYSKKE